MSGHQIRTDYWRKPGPTAAFDWAAVYDDDEPDDDCHMPVGYGRTQADAIVDLITEHPRPDVFCPERGMP